MKVLNSLQSNASVIQARRLQKHRQNENIPQMLEALRKLSITGEDLDRLRVIHIAGTKGKGSTAALCESILRHHGYTTGFYRSLSLCLTQSYH